MSNANCCLTDTQKRPDRHEQVAGMLYVPDQQWGNVYRIEQGFYRGTIFPELDKPWLVGEHYE